VEKESRSEKETIKLMIMLNVLVTVFVTFCIMS